MIRDIRYALRWISRSPQFAATVVLSLGLGIGANTTFFCWLRNIVQEPLPGVPRQEEIAVIVSNQGGGGVSLPDLRDFEKQTGVFTGAAASMTTQVCLTMERQSEWLNAQIVSANFFQLLDVPPLLGRTFLNEEDRKPGGDNVIVLSESLWRRRFHADPKVIGQAVDLNRHRFTIIGVVPRPFHGSHTLLAFDLWAPLSMISEVRNQSRGFLTQRDARGWHNLARLRPGVSITQAQAAVFTGNTQLEQSFPKESRGVRHRVLPLAEAPWGASSILGPVLYLLLAVGAGVQLLVAANVANLLLARGISRQKEIAIRISLGCSRNRLIRQLLTESMLLAVLGGLLGILLARAMVNVMPWFLPDHLPIPITLSFSLEIPTLLATVGLTLATGLLVGLLPAFQTSGTHPFEAMKSGGRTFHSSSSHHRWRNGLVVAEVALAGVLLAGAVLCLKGLHQARQVDYGFRSDHVLLAGLRIGMNGYDRETGKSFYRQAQQRLAEMPGVEEVALASWFPLGLAGCKGLDVLVEGYDSPPNENRTYEYAIVSPRYFATLRIPLLSGRDFSGMDDAQAPAVAIVNEHFAQRFWPGLNPIGQKFKTGGRIRTVIGLAKAGKYNRLDEGAWPFFYLPYQQGVPDLDLSLCIRTAGDPLALTAALRKVLGEIDPGVALLHTIPMESHCQLVLVTQQMASGVLNALCLVALLIAAMGVYAVMTYSVNQRTQEYGVRMALGANTRDILGQVFMQGLRLVSLGLGAGLLLSLFLTRLMQKFLYGVSPFDPAVFLSVSTVLLMVAMLASGLPALRATRIDPIQALRTE